MEHPGRGRMVQAVALLLVALGCAVLMLHDSPGEIGIGFDSAHYVSAAEHLRAGDGLDVSFSSGFEPLPTADALAHYGNVPLTHFPPGYPALLALGDVVLPGGIRAAARAIGAAAVVLVVLFAAALARGLGASPAGSVAVALVVGVGPALQRLSMWALSDAAGAAVALGALALAARGPAWLAARGRAPSMPAVALAAGVVAAAATTIRYGGLGAAAGTAVLVVDLGASRRAQLAAAARAIAPSVLAMGTMFALNAWRGPNAARPVVWHPPGREDVAVLVDTMGMWSVGDHRKAVLRLVAVVTIVALAAVAWWAWRLRARPDREEDRRAPSPARVAAALATFAAVQLAVLLLTSALLDADVSFDRRLAFPVELACTLLVAGAVAAAPRRRVLGVGACVLLALGRRQVTTGIYPQGLGIPYNPPPAPVFTRLDLEPADRVVVTNIPELLWAATGRASIVSPAAHDKLTDRDVAGFDAQLGEMGRLVGARDGVLLVERGDSPRLTRPSDVARVLPCAVVTYEDERALLYDLTPCARPGR